MKRIRAFTLVEALVVLVVIGVAAALLYPVFANAREASKRSLCMSNLRRIGKALAGYVAANDNCYPFAVVQINGEWDSTRTPRFPAGWEKGTPKSLREADASYWANAVRDSLSKSDFACPQSTAVDSFGLLDNQGDADAAWSVSYSYNGYLHSLTASRVTNPELVPVVWEGQGKAATSGASRSSPILLCDDGPCVFNYESGRTVLPLPESLTPGNTMWVHGRGANFLMGDLHVQWKRLGAVSSPKQTQSDRDPFRTYDARGNPSRQWLVQRGVVFAPMFAPFQP